VKFALAIFKLMRKKRRRKKIIPNITINGMATEGKGTGQHEGKMIFVENAVPGDVVDVWSQKNKTDYAIGVVEQIVKPSPLRIEPKCQHFTDCGGCKWQYLDYADQLKYKQQIVTDTFKRIGKINVQPHMQPIIGSEKEWYYRNKMEYTFSSNRWVSKALIESGAEINNWNALGLHVPKFFQKIVDIEHCYLQENTGNQIRNAVRVFAFEHELTFYNLIKHEGFLRTLMLRSTKVGDWMVVLAVAEEKPEILTQLLNHLQNLFPQIKSLNWVLNQKKNDTLYGLTVNCFAGEPFITETLGDLRFKISPQSFFQTNPWQAQRLYDVVKQRANLQGTELVYDLYTGTGSIAQYVASDCSSVVGIEEVEAAIIDAKANAKINNINNCTFLVGDVKNHLNTDFTAEHGQPDLLVVDPPRAGLHKDVVSNILEIAPERVIYVSCNPATQARDVQLLTEKYDLVFCQPVDMFPHTYHIENVVEMQLK